MVRHDNRNSRLDGSRGFTLLELVMALSILAIVTVFAAGFLHPQIRLYYESDMRSRAESMCSEAYRELEQVLRYGYVYYVNRETPDRLAYYVRDPDTSHSGEDGFVYEMLPPVSRWPCISAEDLDVDENGDMTLELDFSGTSSRKANVLIRIMKDGEPVYEQEATVCSMYDYEIEGEMVP